jgi:hypothetical protein
MPESKQPVGGPDEVSKLRGAVHEFNSVMESAGIADRLTFDLSRGPGPDGERVFFASLSHSDVERASLGVVAGALMKLRESGGLSASACRVVTSEGVGHAVAELRREALGRGERSIFGAREVAEVVRAERVVLRRRALVAAARHGGERPEPLSVAAITGRCRFDPSRYAYAGLSASGDADRITNILRFPKGETSLARAEALTAGGSRWVPVSFDFAGRDAEVRGVGLDEVRFALAAAALFDPRSADVARLGHAEGGRVYAIVERDDTTAVVDLLMIKKGPEVFRRNGGLWVRDDILLESFMSPNPPVIVELEGRTQTDVIEQIDAAGANQLVTDDRGENAKPGAVPSTSTGLVARRVGGKRARAAAAGDGVHEAGRAERPVGAARKPENRPSRTPEDSEEGPNTRPSLTASVAAARDAKVAAHARSRVKRIEEATRWYYSDEGYASGFSLTAAIERAELDYERSVLLARREAMARAFSHARRLRAREVELRNVVAPVLAAAG